MAWMHGKHEERCPQEISRGNNGLIAALRPDYITLITV